MPSILIFFQQHPFCYHFPSSEATMEVRKGFIDHLMVSLARFTGLDPDLRGLHPKLKFKAITEFKLLFLVSGGL